YSPSKQCRRCHTLRTQAIMTVQRLMAYVPQRGAERWVITYSFVMQAANSYLAVYATDSDACIFLDIDNEISTMPANDGPENDLDLPDSGDLASWADSIIDWDNIFPNYDLQPDDGLAPPSGTLQKEQMIIPHLSH
ncbi:hypothetical protein T310_9928, partial [Rasamsonia emersonii CBS 393.64]